MCIRDRVDTTAAGDSFSAGYLAVRLTGGDAESAARRGHLTAKMCIRDRSKVVRPHFCASTCATSLANASNVVASPTFSANAAALPPFCSISATTSSCV